MTGLFDLTLILLFGLVTGVTVHSIRKRALRNRAMHNGVYGGILPPKALMEMMGEISGYSSPSRGSANKFVPVRGDDAARFRSQKVRIDGLKAGDVVKWKPGLRTNLALGYNETAEIFRVFPQRTNYYLSGTSSESLIYDCSILISTSDPDGNDYYAEVALDSRRIIRVSP